MLKPKVMEGQFLPTYKTIRVAIKFAERLSQQMFNS
jgi:hypothetical protein